MFAEALCGKSNWEGAGGDASQDSSCPPSGNGDGHYTGEACACGCPHLWQIKFQQEGATAQSGSLVHGAKETTAPIGGVDAVLSSPSPCLA